MINDTLSQPLTLPDPKTRTIDLKYVGDYCHTEIMENLPMSAKSLVLIFSIMLKRAYRYAVSFGSVGTVTMAGRTSSQYTEPVRHTHSKHVGRSAAQTPWVLKWSPV